MVKYYDVTLSLEWPRMEFRLLKTVLSYFLLLFLFVICPLIYLILGVFVCPAGKPMP